MMQQPPDPNAPAAPPSPHPEDDQYQPTGKMLAFHHLLLILSRHWHSWLKDFILVVAIVGATVFLLVKAMTTGADQALLMILSGLVGAITTMLTGHAGMNPYAQMGMGGGMYGGTGGYGGYGGYGSGYSSSPYGQSYGAYSTPGGYPSATYPSVTAPASDPYAASVSTPATTPATGTATPTTTS